MAKLSIDPAELAPALVEALRHPDVGAALRAALAVNEPSQVAPFASVEQYAQRHGVSTRTVRNWLRDGLPCERRRRVVRIPVDVADEWLREHGDDKYIIERARRDAAATHTRLDVDPESDHHDPIVPRRPR